MKQSIKSRRFNSLVTKLTNEEIIFIVDKKGCISLEGGNLLIQDGEKFLTIIDQENDSIVKTRSVAKAFNVITTALINSLQEKDDMFLKKVVDGNIYYLKDEDDYYVVYDNHKEEMGIIDVTDDGLMINGKRYANLRSAIKRGIAYTKKTVKHSVAKERNLISKNDAFVKDVTDALGNIFVKHGILSDNYHLASFITGEKGKDVLVSVTLIKK